jgi:hypothetical protein
MCGQKQEHMIVVKIEKEYCKENGIDRSGIEPIIIDFCDDDTDDLILQYVWSSVSSSQKSMIIGSMTLLSIPFSLQYSFSIFTTIMFSCFCPHIFCNPDRISMGASQKLKIPPSD